MRLSAIVAMSKNRVIGKNNLLPWYLPADLKHFKEITLGKPILMGRKTFESIGRPLPGRLNIVITRNINYKAPGCVVMYSIDAALASISENEEAFIIGGAALFSQLLPRIERLYLTIIHEDFKGDAFFPEINENEWREIESSHHEPDEKNLYHFSFITLDRVKGI